MSDIISRQAAICTIEEYADRLQMVDWNKNPGVMYKAYALNWCINTIRDLPSAQQWIPCSERLPVDDDYRESMECLDGCVWYFTDKGSMGLGYYYYSTKAWSTLRDLKPDGKVIAWMPLPEPYKEGEQDG